MAIISRWLTGNQVEEEYALTKKRLRRLRDQQVITFKLEGNRFIYSRPSIEEYLDKGAIEAKPQKVFVEKLVPTPMEEKILVGGNKMKWEKGPSGRNRANCGDFSLIESTGKRGVHYYMDYFDGTSRCTKGLAKMARELGIETRPIKDRTTAFTIARRVRNALYEEGKNTTQDLDKKDVTFEQFAVDYLALIKAQNGNSYKTKKAIIEGRLVPFFGKFRLEDLNFARTSEYVDMLRKVSIADGTITLYLSVFKRMLNVANRFDYPVDARKVVCMSDYNLRKSERNRELKKEEAERLFEAADPFWKDLLAFALNTGLRLGNICNLKWKSVNLEARNIVISGFESKNKKKFKIWMNPTVFELLKRMHEANGKHDHVFMRDANGSGKTALIDRWVQYEFKRLIDEAGIEDLHFHDLRHTFGCRLVDRGVDLLTIKEAMAHKSITSTLCYVRANENHVRNAFHSLDQDYWGSVGVKSCVKNSAPQG